MLSRVSKAVQSFAPIVLRSGLTRFYSTSPPSDVMDDLYHFNPEKTHKALLRVHNHGIIHPSIDYKNLLFLDTISETPSSNTDRTFDPDRKKFFAVKTLQLETDREWNQANLALRQLYSAKPALSKVLAVNYNEDAQKVKIVTELGKTTAGDYSYFRVKNEKPWTNYELKLLYLNIVNQLNSLREFGGVCEAIRPRNLFYDTQSNIFKLYDLSDFDAIKGYTGFNLDTKVPINVDSAIYSLVQIINPYAPVHNSEEAHAYLRANHPDFLNEFEALQTQVKKWQYQRAQDNATVLQDQLKNPKTKWFSEYDYERFFVEKMESVWEAKGLSKNSGEWASLNQGIGNYIEAINTLQQQLSKMIETYGENNQNTSKIYLDLAEVYKAADNFEHASKYFTKAISSGEADLNMDKLIMAQIYNSCGKFFIDKKNFEEAHYFFNTAEAILRESPKKLPILAAEIQTNRNSCFSAQQRHSNNNQDTKNNNTSSSSNSNGSNKDPNKSSGLSVPFKILYFVVFVKVTTMVLKKIQELLDNIPDYNPKKELQEPTTSQSNGIEATTLQKDQPSTKSEQAAATESKTPNLKSEDKQLVVGDNADLSAQSSSQGTTIKESLLFGAILLISALGLSL